MLECNLGRKFFRGHDIFFGTVFSATAGPDKVKFPQYQTHVLYDVLDQPENKEVRELYVNPRR